MSLRLAVREGFDTLSVIALSPSRPKARGGGALGEHPGDSQVAGVGFRSDG